MRSRGNGTTSLPIHRNPYRHPRTRRPESQLPPEALEAIFPKTIIAQEMSTERYIDIPEEVRAPMPGYAGRARFRGRSGWRRY